jgi:predicted nucleic acid-binding protein
VTAATVVVDASLIVASLVPGPMREPARRLLLRLAGEAALLAPAGLVDAEVLNGVRKAWLRGAVRSIAQAVEAYLAIPIHRVQVSPLLLRAAVEAVAGGRLSGQDAVYLALATLLNAGLASLDNGLARAAAGLLGAEKVLQPRPREDTG